MLKTIDLFAGAGGLSYGFESTGEFLIVAAAENNKNARKTYIENHKGRNDIRMITDVRGYDFSALASEFDGIDVVIGGPPCQGFSNANRQKNHIISMNNSLVKEYFRAIREIRPKAFVMENVSMLSSETHRFYDSTKDHNVVTELGVQMREDELVLSDSDYHGYSLMNIIEAAVNDVTGKPFGSEMTIKNGQVTAVGKTILTKPKNLLGKKEGTKFIISGKQYVIKDIK